jgi:hypothetical protein
MVKMSTLVQKFKNPFFSDSIPEKMVKQITFPKQPEITAQNKSYPEKTLLIPHSNCWATTGYITVR